MLKMDNIEYLKINYKIVNLIKNIKMLNWYKETETYKFIDLMIVNYKKIFPVIFKVLLFNIKITLIKE